MLNENSASGLWAIQWFLNILLNSINYLIWYGLVDSNFQKPVAQDNQNSKS